nr:hypothetical protein M01A12.2 - Caenorhabditis elegans [Caenorhabditis elegans]
MYSLIYITSFLAGRKPAYMHHCGDSVEREEARERERIAET